MSDYDFTRERQEAETNRRELKSGKWREPTPRGTVRTATNPYLFRPMPKPDGETPCPKCGEPMPVWNHPEVVQPDMCEKCQVAEGKREEREQYREWYEKDTIPRGIPTSCPECGSEWDRMDEPNYSRLPRMYCEKCRTGTFYRKTRTTTSSKPIWVGVTCEGLITRGIQRHVWARTKVNGKLKTMCMYCGIAPIYPHLTYAAPNRDHRWGLCSSM